MRTFLRGFILTILSLTALTSVAQTKKQIPVSYFPPAGTWEKRSPEQSGIDREKLNKAIDYAIASESKNPRSMEINHYRTFGKSEPFGDGIGPFKDRGNQTGVIIHKGFLLASWGDPERPDMTHSVTKSFLSTVTGLAFDAGLIRNVHDTVRPYIAPILPALSQTERDKPTEIGKPYFIELFETPHNRKITWDHLLRQTSDWEGTLWGKPEWADRPTGNPDEWMTRARNKPGSVYEYNDVRVNVLSLATLMVWRKPLPVVLKERIMDPIGASATWRWYGYENSWIILDGQMVQSVSGGGHWGGGMVIHAMDMARFGYLLLRNGKWGEQQLLSPQWITMASTPTTAQNDYGYMNWFLNTGKKFLPSAPESAVTHVGNGTNIIYVDRENDLVVVCRWIENNKLDGFIASVLEAIRK
jgi:hypothetical protein